MNEYSGTLKIFSFVVLGDREKTITLATIDNLRREECGEIVGEFLRANPQYRKAPLFADWTCRQPVPVGSFQREYQMGEQMV